METSTENNTVLIVHFLKTSCYSKAMFIRGRFQTDPNGPGPKISFLFTRERSRTVLKSLFWISTGPVLETTNEEPGTDPYRFQTVPCKQLSM